MKKAVLVSAAIFFSIAAYGQWTAGMDDDAGKINLVIDALPKTVPNCAVASSEGLKNQDAHHFDRESQRVLAARYYEAFKRCGDRIEVDSRCLRLNGKPIVPIMGEMHYSRVPRAEWAEVKERIRALPDGRVAYTFCDEFICECRADMPRGLLEKWRDPNHAPCPAGRSFGVVGPNGVYRACLHSLPASFSGKEICETANV